LVRRAFDAANKIGDLTFAAYSCNHLNTNLLAAVTTNGNACLPRLARDPPDVEEARECLQRIIRDGHRASDVIARLRALVQKSAPAKARLDLRGHDSRSARHDRP
jgi:hypothetical protein